MPGPKAMTEVFVEKAKISENFFLGRRRNGVVVGWGNAYASAKTKVGKINFATSLSLAKLCHILIV